MFIPMTVLVAIVLLGFYITYRILEYIEQINDMLTGSFVRLIKFEMRAKLLRSLSNK